MSESISCHHEKDGTLVVTVPKGTNVGRVLVQEEGTCIGSLYYPDHFADVSKMMDTISRAAAIKQAEKEAQVDGAYGYMDIKSIVDMLNDLPSAQPEIIRCNSCKYWTQSTGKIKGYGLGRCDFHEADLVVCNGFCYWAERRNNG